MAYISLSVKDLGTFAIIFVLYGVLGNTLEHALYFFSKTKTKTLSNPVMTGFPLYSIAAYVAIGIHNAFGKNLHPIVQFFVYATIAVMIEYAAGMIIGAGENGYNADGTLRTWDYRQDALNYKGVIKLSGFIFFGIMSMIVVRIHPFLKERVGRIFNDESTTSTREN